MKSFANDPSLDRVLLISREEMGGAAGGFDPLHPVYTQTEGADPFTYRNDFCRMRLLPDGTVELTEFGRPARFAEEWRQLLSQLAACRTLTDLRIYDYDGDEPPMAAALTTYGRLLLYGNAGEYAPAAGWQGVARVFWDTDGFGALCEDEMFRAARLRNYCFHGPFGIGWHRGDRGSSRLGAAGALQSGGLSAAKKRHCHPL